MQPGQPRRCVAAPGWPPRPAAPLPALPLLSSSRLASWPTHCLYRPPCPYRPAASTSWRLWSCSTAFTAWASCWSLWPLCGCASGGGTGSTRQGARQCPGAPHGCVASQLQLFLLHVDCQPATKAAWEAFWVGLAVGCVAGRGGGACCRMPACMVCPLTQHVTRTHPPRRSPRRYPTLHRPCRIPFPTWGCIAMLVPACLLLAGLLIVPWVLVSGPASLAHPTCPPACTALRACPWRMLLLVPPACQPATLPCFPPALRPCHGKQYQPAQPNHTAPTCRRATWPSSPSPLPPWPWAACCTRRCRWGCWV